MLCAPTRAPVVSVLMLGHERTGVPIDYSVKDWYSATRSSDVSQNL
jgi:hypothetical protein